MLVLGPAGPSSNTRGELVQVMCDVLLTRRNPLGVSMAVRPRTGGRGLQSSGMEAEDQYGDSQQQNLMMSEAITGGLLSEALFAS